MRMLCTVPSSAWLPGVQRTSGRTGRTGSSGSGWRRRYGRPVPCTLGSSTSVAWLYHRRRSTSRRTRGMSRSSRSDLGACVAWPARRGAAHGTDGRWALVVSPYQRTRACRSPQHRACSLLSPMSIAPPCGRPEPGPFQRCRAHSVLTRIGPCGADGAAFRQPGSCMCWLLGRAVRSGRYRRYAPLSTGRACRSCGVRVVGG